MVREISDILGRWFGLFNKVAFQNALHGHLNTRPLLPFSALGCDFIEVACCTRGTVRLVEPLLEERLQFAHILEGQLEGFKPTDCRLAKHVTVECTQREPNIGLCVTEFNPSLFEHLRKMLEIVG